ncbi:hypothetical protein N7540_009970 [Penicillium herquei]|nr:hypothetical protein N7540_009970 [Penicillium herquei]
MARPRQKINVSIDFGTTYSAVAWLDTTNVKSELVTGWPGSSATSDPLDSESEAEFPKVPSELAYISNDEDCWPLWGYQIDPNMPRLQWIKLGLDPVGNDQLLRDLASKPRDPLWMYFPRHVTAKIATTDYLESLKHHLFDILELEYGRRGFEKFIFQFVVTVPGIWSAKAIGALLECAKNAGFDEELPIKLVSEPEAAAIHMVVCSQTDLQVGQRFILCDAGGGTVDLITVEIVEISPKTRLRQVVASTGGLCGSSFLNRGFEALLREKFKGPLWRPLPMSLAIAQFEEFKRGFTGQGNELGDSIEGNEPIVTDIICYSDTKDEIFMKIHIYEAITSLGFEPHLYPRKGMKVHAAICAHFDLKAARRQSHKSFHKRGHCYAIPCQLVAKYSPTHL